MPRIGLEFEPQVGPAVPSPRAKPAAARGPAPLPPGLPPRGEPPALTSRSLPGSRTASRAAGTGTVSAIGGGAAGGGTAIVSNQACNCPTSPVSCAASIFTCPTACIRSGRELLTPVGRGLARALVAASVAQPHVNLLGPHRPFADDIHQRPAFEREQVIAFVRPEVEPPVPGSMEVLTFVFGRAANPALARGSELADPARRVGLVGQFAGVNLAAPLFDDCFGLAADRDGARYEVVDCWPRAEVPLLWAWTVTGLPSASRRTGCKFEAVFSVSAVAAPGDAAPGGVVASKNIDSN